MREAARGKGRGGGLRFHRYRMLLLFLLCSTNRIKSQQTNCPSLGADKAPLYVFPSKLKLESPGLSRKKRNKKKQTGWRHTAHLNASAEKLQGGQCPVQQAVQQMNKTVLHEAARKVKAP